MAPDDRRALVLSFLEAVELQPPQPQAQMLPFDPVPALSSVRWRLSLVGWMIQDELHEATNQINSWLGDLWRWRAWIDVTGALENQARWEAQWEWVEPIAFRALFQPSATRDRLGRIALMALHQAGLALDPDRPDVMLGDPASPEDKPQFLSRPRREAEIERLARAWERGPALVKAIRALDGQFFIQQTLDFRNRSSHGIAPRLTVGYTRMVSRTLAQHNELAPGPGGLLVERAVPGEMRASYGVGGDPPLEMLKVWQACCDEFTKAQAAFWAYVALLEDVVRKAPMASGVAERP